MRVQDGSSPERLRPSSHQMVMKAAGVDRPRIPPRPRTEVVISADSCASTIGSCRSSWASPRPELGGSHGAYPDPALEKELEPDQSHSGTPPDPDSRQGSRTSPG